MNEIMAVPRANGMHLRVLLVVAAVLLPILVMPARMDASSVCYASLPGSADFWIIRKRWLVTKHPLVARVYKVGAIFDGKETLPEHGCAENFSELALFSRNLRGLFEDHTVVLIGEVHDNVEHHILQAWMAMPADQPFGKKPLAALVLEQLNNQAPLDTFFQSPNWKAHGATLDEMKRAFEWNKSNWAKYYYDPIFYTSLYAEMLIYAGDVPRDAIMKVAKEGEGALSADDRARLKLDIPLGSKLDDASLSEIEEAHCGTMPKEAFTGMAYAQRYRDATLADNVLKAADKHGSAILIAGNGHVRTDRGVPWYIRQRAPDKKVVSVMLIEVEDGKTDPEDYVPRDPDGRPAADYIIFTPRADREDPCVTMRKRMGK